MRSESMRLVDKEAHVELDEQSPSTAYWLALILMLIISVDGL